VDGNILTIFLSFVYVALSLGLYAQMKKIYGEFVARKILHALVGAVILIPISLGASLWATIVPSLIFIAVNLWLNKKGFWKDFEGIITYSLAILIATFLGYLVDMIYFILPTFIMAYGDPLAAMVGRMVFKKFQKSWQGSLTMLGVSFIISLGFLQFWEALTVAVVATLAEGHKWDNITVPLAVSGVLWLLI
jgi:phytol kinase